MSRQTTLADDPVDHAIAAATVSADIAKRFGFHEVTDQRQVEEIASVRTAFLNLATTLSYLPDGRAKSLALTELESASHWAIKALTHR